jgi:biopolymer transport protein ExbD
VPLKSLPLDEPTINLTTMLDVVMLLIIFFMIGTQFTEEERQYDIKLPTVADVTALTGQPDEIIVNVNAEGQITIRTEPKSLVEAEALLLAARERFPGQAVVVRGDGRGQYQYVMDVMAAARRAGIRNLSLANQPQKAAP